MASIRHKSNKWQARVKRTGIVAEKSFQTKQEAVRWARQIEVKIELGEYVSPTPTKSRMPDPICFGELIRRYSKEVATQHRSPTSQINLRILSRDLGHLKLNEVEPKSIAAWRDKKLKKIKSASVNRLIGTLGSIINHARKEWQLSIVNPVPDIKRPPNGQSRTRRLEDNEEQRLLAALDKKYVHIVKFAIATGMRRGEILGLKWWNVDVDLKIAQLPMTKNGESRQVPLSSAAIEVIDEVADSNVWSINGAVFDIHPEALHRAWCRACKKTGIKGLRLHDLRREAVSRFFEIGLNVMEVSAISGHKTLSQLQTYTRLDTKKLVPKLG